MTEPLPHRTDAFGDTFEFDPRSLVGSWFLAGPDPGWGGQIVAEPSPGVYLVEYIEWLVGMPDSQGLVRIEEMIDNPEREWRFFDTAEWMWNDYNHGTGKRWEYQREEAKDATAEDVEPAPNGDDPPKRRIRRQ